MSDSYQQLNILEDDADFKPLKTPKKNQVKSPLKTKNISFCLTKIDKNKNKLILYQKKQLERFQKQLTYSQRYKKNGLFNLAQKTKSVLKYRSCTKVKNIGNTLKQKINLQEGLSKKSRASASPPLVTRQSMNNSSIYFYRNNPEERLSRNKDGWETRSTHQKIEQYFKNIIKNSIRPSSRKERQLEKEQYSVFNTVNAQQKIQIDLKKKEKVDKARKLLSHQMKRPNTTHVSNRKRHYIKQQPLSFQNLQPW